MLENEVTQLIVDAMVDNPEVEQVDTMSEITGNFQDDNQIYCEIDGKAFKITVETMDKL